MVGHVQGDKILELGCGDGRLLEALGVSGHSVQGVDVDEKAVSLAIERGLPVELADALKHLKEQPDDSVDMIISMHYLEHTEDPHAVLMECIRVAKIGMAHLIPIGRYTEQHQQHWNNLAEIRDEPDFEGFQVELGPESSALILYEKNVSEHLRGYAGASSFMLIPNFICLVGSSVQKPTGMDTDILARSASDDMGIALQLRNQLRLQGVAPEFHMVCNPKGPHGPFIPLYDLVAVKKPELETIVPQVTDYRKVGASPVSWVRPLKPSHAYDTLDEAWKDWGQDHAANGIHVEWKADGNRVHLVKDGDDVRIYSNNQGQEYSAQLPHIVDAIKQTPGNFVIDAELLAYEHGGTPAPREVTTSLLTGPPGQDELAIAWVFDVLYMDGVWHLDETYDDRRKLLAKLHLKGPRLAKMPTIVAHNEAEFMAYAKKVNAVPGTEGAMFKDSKSKHLENGATPDWCKVKIVYEIRVQVVEVKPLKRVENRPQMYTYAVAMSDGKGGLVPAENTMATSVTAEKGDIIELRVLNVFKKPEGYSFLLPRVIENRTDRKEPDTTSRADQVLAEIERRRTKSLLMRVTKSIVEKAVLMMKVAKKEEKLVPASRTIGMLKEGMKGKFVMQIHDVRTLHADFRLEIPQSVRAQTFIGWQLFIPSRLRKVVEGDPEQTLQETGKLVAEHLLSGGTLAGSFKTVVGPSVWVDIGKGNMETFPKGGPGGSPNKEGHMKAFEWGSYVAGPVLEGHHSVFYKLSGKRFKERWLMIVGVKPHDLGRGPGLAEPESEGRTWFFRLLKEGSVPGEGGSNAG